MTREQEITNFLRFIADLAKENDISLINHKVVYHHLIRLGVKKNDLDIDLASQPSKQFPGVKVNLDKISPFALPNSTFNHWVQTNANNQRLECFISSEAPYSCFFLSKNEEKEIAPECIKVYIPLDADHIEFGAKLIFDFLASRHIPHQSRVGRRIRFDDIVVRLASPQDAEKLMNFVENTSYLKDGLLRPNPFAFQKNGFAIAVDGYTNYNGVLADLICMYIRDKKQDDTLDYIEANDFYAFVRELFVGQFIVHNGVLNDYLTEKIKEAETKKKTELDQIAKENIILTHRQVMKLILNASNPNFDYGGFKGHYKEVIESPILKERDILEVKRMLVEAAEAMTIRLNYNGLENVKGFVLIGNPYYITTRNNLRERMVRFNFGEKIQQILKYENKSFDEYANEVLAQYHVDLDSLIQKKK